MPEQLDPNWEYWEPDPEVAELLADSAAEPDEHDLFSTGAFNVPLRGVASRRPNAVCAVCSAHFVSRGPHHRNCSRLCGAAVTRRNPLRQSESLARTRECKPLLPKRCATCQRPFPTRWPTKRYCSINCNPCGSRPVPAPEELALTIDEAKSLAREGVLFGELYPHLAEADREPFRQWWVCDRAVGVAIAARDENSFSPNGDGTIRAITARAVPTGNLCTRCGGITVRTGTCETCQSCGESSGGCG